VAIDMNRMAAAALEAAVNGEQPRRRFSGLKAMAAGAVLATVARAAAKRGPDLGQLMRLGELGDSVRDRLADRGWIGDEPDEDEAYDDEEVYEDEEPEAEEDEEPEAEADDEDDWDDEDAEPQEDDEFDEEDDEDPDDDEDDDEDEDEDDEPEHERSSAPPIARGNGRHVDPAARPPKPPQKRKSKAGRR
jgi:hypothetical protein